MASPSEIQRSVCPSMKTFHVFVSHYGKDTKLTLASSIYYSLKRSGLNVFFDLEEFKGGQKIESTIKQAISSCSVGIVILSTHFAYSRWCLNEIFWMQETDAVIIPVFDRIPPEDVQKLRSGEGAYALAFENFIRKKRYDANIDNWKNALYKLCDISGLELNSQKFNGDQGKLVDDMYTQVMQHLRKVWRKSVDGLFGLQEAVDDFNDFVEAHGEQSENVKIVGIVGTPGSGTSTLAEEFYYRRRSEFDGSSLLVGVRNASEQNGLLTLQSQILKDLTNDCFAFRNISEGKDILADRVRRLCHKVSLKFLIVIDDVCCQDQLEALLRKEDVLRSGSLVIVTSHSEAVLKLSGISLIYRAEPLDPNSAQELLCRIVFDQAQPISGFESLTETALNKCGCFPRFLKSLGQNLVLYGNNEKRDWETELGMMIPEIFEAICGDLQEEERQIFLDICFFGDKDKNSAIRVWNGSGWRGARVLRKLEYMCLVEVNDATNFISIPDRLGDLGQEIASHPNLATNFLKKTLNEAAPRIRGTREASHKLSQRTIGELLKVELLDVSGDIPSDKFSQGLRNLVWLHWQDCSEIPITLKELKNLRVLELSNGKFKKLDQLPVELKEIIVEECLELEEISTSIDSLSHLEKMALHCTGVKFLPQEFCELRALEHLVLRQCKELQSLPADFGILSNLQYIDLSYCIKLSSLPQSFRELTRLKTLEVSFCKELVIEADMFEQNRSIDMTMQNCKELRIAKGTTLQGFFTNRPNLFGTPIRQLQGGICQLPALDRLTTSLTYLSTWRPLTSCNHSYGPLPLLESGES